MTLVTSELITLIRQLRGGLAWHTETHPGEGIPVPEGFELPPLGHALEKADVKPVQPPSTLPSETEDARPPSQDDGDMRLNAFLQEARSRNTNQRARPTEADKAIQHASQPKREEKPSGDAARPGVFVAQSGQELTEFDLRAVALQRLREDADKAHFKALGENAAPLVHGHGSSRARLMFVADGPGVAEQEIGVPFVGETGLLLGRMIRAMGLRRSDVYLTYVSKCRTGAQPCELHSETCRQLLEAEIQVVNPEAIIALGELAARTFAKSTDAFPHLRGRWVEYEGVSVMSTFHPLALLQHPQSKARVWEDLQLVMKKLGMKRPT